MCPRSLTAFAIATWRHPADAAEAVAWSEAHGNTTGEAKHVRLPREGGAGGKRLCVLALAGCAQLLGGGGTTTSGPPECASFSLPDTTINVGSAGGTFNLGNDNQLVFSRGAVTSGRALTR